MVNGVKTELDFYTDEQMASMTEEQRHEICRKDFGQFIDLSRTTQKEKDYDKAIDNWHNCHCGAWNWSENLSMPVKTFKCICE